MFCGTSSPSGRNRNGLCPWPCNGRKRGTLENHPGFEMGIAKEHDIITQCQYLKLRFLPNFNRFNHKIVGKNSIYL